MQHSASKASKHGSHIGRIRKEEIIDVGVPVAAKPIAVVAKLRGKATDNHH